jgi:hypothetical protein
VDERRNQFMPGTAAPETRAYVARILGLMDGAGALVAPELEVRLVE